MSDTKSLPVGAIGIGNRCRKEMGDIASLAASIGDVGLLQPIVVRPDNRLVSGERRLKACERLGWDTVPVRVACDLDEEVKFLRAERDENTCRKDFTISEAVAIKQAIEGPEREQAKNRQQEGRKRGGATAGRGRKKKKDGANLAPSNEENGKTRERVAAETGLGHTTLDKAEFVLEKAKENPELFQPIADEMERTGKVDPAYKKAQKQDNWGDVPLEETKVEKTAADAISELFEIVTKKLDGIERKYGDWKTIAKNLGATSKRHMVDYNLAPLFRRLASMRKELNR